MKWETISTEKIMNDYHVSVMKNKVRLPEGAVIDDFYTVTIPDAAMIAALTTDGCILLKKEFRYACGEDVIECPAGMFEPGEDALTVAKRELLEETGYSSDCWTYLGPTMESTSKLTNTMHLFLAVGCQCVGEQNLDPNEYLDVIKVGLHEAVEMVMDGRINANSTAHLLLKVEKLWNANRPTYRA